MHRVVVDVAQIDNGFRLNRPSSLRVSVLSISRTGTDRAPQRMGGAA
jgi:hypothetical protein